METLHFSATVTQYPEDGPPRVSCGPWRILIPEGPHHSASLDLGPYEGHSAYMIRLNLYDIVPARPGWLSATGSLESWDGSLLTETIPVQWYARPSEAGTHIYFPAGSMRKSGWSVCLRLDRGGV